MVKFDLNFSICLWLRFIIFCKFWKNSFWISSIGAEVIFRIEWLEKMFVRLLIIFLTFHWSERVLQHKKEIILIFLVITILLFLCPWLFESWLLLFFLNLFIVRKLTNCRRHACTSQSRLWPSYFKPVIFLDLYRIGIWHNVYSLQLFNKSLKLNDRLSVWIVKLTILHIEHAIAKARIHITYNVIDQSIILFLRIDECNILILDERARVEQNQINSVLILPIIIYIVLKLIFVIKWLNLSFIFVRVS